MRDQIGKNKNSFGEMGVDDSYSVVYTHTDTVMIYCSFIGPDVFNMIYVHNWVFHFLYQIENIFYPL